ncbi:MAG: hypothetical protein DHS20C19_07080 [Acidimicrobiales bacterium]|nr:MAG: hypothetical protein DHS20C19_07080 [Acidimicrobiales bacterium]
MTDIPTGPRSLPSQMGAHMRLVDGVPECWLEVTPERSHREMALGACLVMLADVGAGYAAEIASEDDWSFTVDIGVRRTPCEATEFRGRPVVQRAGRTVSIDLPLVDDTGAATATAVSTFIRLPRRPQDPPRPDFPIDSMSWAAAPEAPLAELLGAEATDRGLSVELGPQLLNPAGILQGGVSALLAELAALRVLEATSGPLVTTSFDVRYVTMGRVGPFEAVVDPIGPHAAAVKVLDRGADAAVVTHNLLSFTATSGV